MFKFKSKKILAAASVAAVCLLLVLLLISPQEYTEACTQGITLWAGAVLPALFPFFVLTSTLTEIGAGQKLSAALTPLANKCKLPKSAAYCFLLSALSGYPIGARTCADLYERGDLSAQGAARTAVLASTSGPMFLLASVGATMFRSTAAGAILLLSHLTGVVAVSVVILLFSKKLPPDPPVRIPKKQNSAFSECIQKSVVSVLSVGGFIALFFVIFRAVVDLRLTAPLEFLLKPIFGESGATALCAGLLEATHGCAMLAQSECSLALPAAAFTVTFGGACILAQQLAFLKKTGISPLYFVGVKFLQGVAAFGVCALFCRL